MLKSSWFDRALDNPNWPIVRQGDHEVEICVAEDEHGKTGDYNLDKAQEQIHRVGWTG